MNPSLRRKLNLKVKNYLGWDGSSIRRRFTLRETILLVHAESNKVREYLISRATIKIQHTCESCTYWEEPPPLLSLELREEAWGSYTIVTLWASLSGWPGKQSQTCARRARKRLSLGCGTHHPSLYHWLCVSRLLAEAVHSLASLTSYFVSLLPLIQGGTGES